MPIFIHPPNRIAPAADVDGAPTRAELMDEARLIDSVARLQDGEDRPEPTDIGVGVAVSVGELKSHVDIHRCRRVLVTVNFAGEPKARRFIPSATIDAVRRWAVGIHGFDLSAEQRPGQELGVCDTAVVPDRNVRVGMLATRCRLCLDLAPRDQFHG